MIEVQNLTMHYGSVVALAGISFRVKEGEILGLVGPNGAGKTTAMRILTTYLYPTSGTAKIDNLDILEQSTQVRNRMGYLPETAPLYVDMQVEEYLSFVAHARGIFGKNLSTRLHWVKDACSLRSVWKHPISEISKGYRQRVGLAQALIHDPKVLILDEPTSGLDPLQIIGIRDLIKSLAKKKTIIFSTHILQEVEAIADRIVIINEGKIISQGSLQELAIEAQSKGQTKADPTLEDIFIALLTSKKEKPEIIKST